MFWSCPDWTLSSNSRGGVYVVCLTGWSYLYRGERLVTTATSTSNPARAEYYANQVNFEVTLATRQEGDRTHFGPTDQDMWMKCSLSFVDPRSFHVCKFAQKVTSDIITLLQRIWTTCPERKINNSKAQEHFYWMNGTYCPLHIKGRLSEVGEGSTLEFNAPLVSRRVQHGLGVLTHVRLADCRHQVLWKCSSSIGLSYIFPFHAKECLTVVTKCSEIVRKCNYASLPQL